MIAQLGIHRGAGDMAQEVECALSMHETLVPLQHSVARV